MDIKGSLPYALLALLLLSPSSGKAWSSTEEEPLSFGIFAAPDNSSVHKLRIFYDNSLPDTVGQIYILEPGRAGRYRLSGLPANRSLNITVTATPMSTVANPQVNEEFVLDSFIYPPTITDATGSALLELGATLSTTGSGSSYQSTQYRATITITVNL